MIKTSKNVDWLIDWKEENEMKWKKNLYFRQNYELRLIKRNKQESKSDDKITNEDRYTRAILASGRVSEWFRSVRWAKRVHTESTGRSQYFVFKMTVRRLDDERTERGFYSSEGFSFIHIVYSNSRMSWLKSMTQRVWNIIIIKRNKNALFCSNFTN